ncbi:unnamed protein product [Dovyalis caffra]|uniref:Uncharacterized protein n=1 Tax=Dovyalis caffra TaxID=77055 RepID=A0AAV1SGS1_9ROSI|nr:unnamed protein product [Dovyalis caffra]
MAPFEASLITTLLLHSRRLILLSASLNLYVLHRYAVMEGRPLREDRLPCCGGIPWYVGAFLLLCAQLDYREKPGYVACAIARIAIERSTFHSFCDVVLFTKMMVPFPLEKIVEECLLLCHTSDNFNALAGVRELIVEKFNLLLLGHKAVFTI